jgi:uncharacterized protein YsxB (DUF464 family)
MKLNAVFEQQDGLYVSAAVSGHAEYESGSEDGMILCAAVSSAMQLTCNTLTECFGAAVSIIENPASDAQNLLSFRLDSPDSVQSELLHGLLIHMQALAEDFDGMLSVKLKKCKA